VDRENATLYALNGDNGAVVWSLPVPDTEKLNLKPVVIDDGVIYYDYPHGLYIIEQAAASSGGAALRTRRTGNPVSPRGNAGYRGHAEKADILNVSVLNSPP
jgi:hypothetical protein